MHTSDIHIAAGVIRRCGRERNADLELRETLKSYPDLPQASKKGIAQAVFNYFSWLGFLDSKRPLPAQIHEAELVAEHFQRNPTRFDSADLQNKAIPAWIAEQVPISKAWITSLQSPPRLWIRTRKAATAEVLQTVVGCEPAPVASFTETFEYRGEENLFETEAFKKGLFEIQDISSQAVGYVSRPNPGETWWDACSGEGGKALHLSDLMAGKGMIWCTDRSKRRLELFRKRAARAGAYNVRIKEWVNLQHRPVKSSCHGVVVDAPCSGVGTWARNPQARWTLEPKDVAELKDVQLNLLTQAAQQVAPGGRLIYSVCTLTAAETTDVVAGIAEYFGSLGLSPKNFNHPFAEKKGTHHFIWPQKTGGNGMFIAMWERQK